MRQQCLVNLMFTMLALTGCSVSDHEITALIDALSVTPGMHIADIGAGDGEYTFALAEAVGAEGHVYATELDRDKLEELRARLIARNITNVTVIPAGSDTTGLPRGCCDGAFMRNVYHHLSAPEGILQDLRGALKPSATLVVIDFLPGSILDAIAPDDQPEGRTGHGVTPATVALTARDQGFVAERTIDDWPAGAFVVEQFAVVLKRDDPPAR